MLHADSKVSKYLMLGLSIFFTLCFLGVSIYLIYLTSLINWFLSVIVSFICIIIIAVLAWYSVKAAFTIRSVKRQEAEYDVSLVHSLLEGSIDKKYLNSLFRKEEYKRIESSKSGYKFVMYLKLNEASPLLNYVFVTVETIKEPIMFNNIIDQMMLIHDVPSGLFRTLIIVSCSKPDKQVKNICYLNNPYNVAHQKYYCSFDTSKKEAYLGEYNELTSNDFVVTARGQLSLILRLRESR